MNCITYHMMQQLRAVGFSFPDYEHCLNLGMVFYYNNDEYYIGGFGNSEYSKLAIVAAREGCWLPSEDQLLEWLYLVGFDVDIHLTSDLMRFRVTAKDQVNQMQYFAQGGSLAYALHKLIYKICKAKKRQYIPRSLNRIELSSDKK